MADVAAGEVVGGAEVGDVSGSSLLVGSNTQSLEKEMSSSATSPLWPSLSSYLKTIWGHIPKTLHSDLVATCYCISALIKNTINKLPEVTSRPNVVGVVFIVNIVLYLKIENYYCYSNGICGPPVQSCCSFCSDDEIVPLVSCVTKSTTSFYNYCCMTAMINLFTPTLIFWPAGDSSTNREHILTCYDYIQLIWWTYYLHINQP